MSVPGTMFSIPLPPPDRHSQTGAEGGRAGHLVADFLGATDALSCEATAALAGVRTETIRKWRRRLPRIVKGATSRRMRAHLAGKPLPALDEGFQRLFRRLLRSIPGPNTSRA